jgi:beta-lactam-binding protein with PASTA domain
MGIKVKVKVPGERGLSLPAPVALFLDEIRRILEMIRVYFVRSLGGMALFAIFILCAFVTMRVAIHGREVTVPNLANLSDADAATALKKLGLNLSVENRFYAATVPANRVLSQSPAPGALVRSGWQIRVTESLGTQQVPVPDVTGQDEHPAELMLHRLQLDLGTVARIPAPSPAGVILAQSPPPNVTGLDGPRVALLIAADEPAPASVGYVMPSLIGLTVGEANQRLVTVGLHLASAASTPADASDTPAADPAIPSLAVPRSPRAVAQITGQTPLPGRRVSRADNIRVIVY